MLLMLSKLLNCVQIPIAELGKNSITQVLGNP